MKVYISGKMSGMPEYNSAAFYDAEKQLLARGYEVGNPARLFRLDNVPSWEECMKQALTMQLTCDAIYMLDGWQHDSRGAKIEFDLAKELKYTFIATIKERITVDQVLEAYAKTGLTPMRSDFFPREGCACGLGVIAAHRFNRNLDELEDCLGDDYIQSFAAGFDGNTNLELFTPDAYADGKAAWEAVKDKAEEL